MAQRCRVSETVLSSLKQISQESVVLIRNPAYALLERPRVQTAISSRGVEAESQQNSNKTIDAGSAAAEDERILGPRSREEAQTGSQPGVHAQRRPFFKNCAAPSSSYKKNTVREGAVQGAGKQFAFFMRENNSRFFFYYTP